MMTSPDPRLVGFLEIQLGRTKVRVPVRESNEGLGDEIAAFSADLGGGVILVRDGASERDVERAMTTAARDAAKHFSRKLLN